MTLFFYPFGKNYNLYSENMRKIIAKATGVELSSLPKSISTRFLFRSKTFFINWFEDIPFSKSGRLSILRVLVFFYFLVVFLMPWNRLIFVRHNHHRHGAVGFQRRLSVLFIKCLEFAATKKVVLAQTYALQNEPYFYLPHVRYQSNYYPRNQIIRTQCKVVGKLDARKNIHSLLDVWPANIHLRIVGAAALEYELELMKIVDKRNLNVEIINKQLAEDEYNAELYSASHVVIPHGQTSNIVSGALIHALSLGCRAICTDSPYADELRSLLGADLIVSLDEVKHIGSEVGEPDLRAFDSEFGFDNQIEIINSLFGSLGR